MIRPSSHSLTGALALVLVLAACDTSAPDSGDAADLTEAEVTEATAIIADALAEDAGGLAASTRDLTASVSADSMRAGPRGVRGHRGRGDRPPCRADYELTYDEATGTHTVSYACSRETETGTASFGSELTYQFRDASGGFVPEPGAVWESVDAVTFGGVRSGSVARSRGEVQFVSAFEQTGEWALTALADDATPGVLAGRQRRTGSRSVTGPDSSRSRAFSLDLSGSGIELREGADGLGHAAVGELVYTLEMEVTRNGEAETRTVEGTIDLEDDGRALLRVFGLRTVYRISLGDGATDRQTDRPGVSTST